MRLHTDTITADHLTDAARTAGVGLTYSRHGSRTRHHAWEITLTGSSPYPRNPGGPGVPDGYDPTERAATWDQWGIFLAHLFRQDPNATTRDYLSGEHYRWATGNRYDTLTPTEQHKRHKWATTGDSVTGTYFVQECGCGAILRRLHATPANARAAWDVLSGVTA
jgi:hypothetical protein